MGEKEFLLLKNSLKDLESQMSNTTYQVETKKTTFSITNLYI